MSVAGRIVATYRAAFSGLPREAWLVSAVVLVNRSGTMVLPFLVLFLTRERGYSVATAGRVLGMYGIGSIIGAYLGGWLSDRIGPTRTQQVSLLGGGAAVLVLGRTHGELALGVTALTVSALSDLFRPACMTAMARACEGQAQARAFALLRLAVNLGMGVGPAVGGFLARQNYAWVFRCDAATSFAAAAVLFWVHGFKDPETPKPAAGAAESRPPWRDRPYVVLLLLAFVLGCVFFQLFATFPLYAHAHFGIDEAGFGLLLGLNAGLIVVFEMVLIHLLEHRDRMRISAIGAFLICLGFGLMPLSRAYGWAIGCVVVWTVGEMTTLPMLNAIAADRAGAGNRGKYLGAYSTAYSVAFALAPLVGAWAYERIGPDAMWFAVAGIGVALWFSLQALAPSFRSRS